MKQSTSELGDDASRELKAQYQLLKQERPGIRARDAARELGVPEGSLLAAHVGSNVTRLDDNAQAILKDVLALGEVMALTRNESCVHERKGLYDNCHFFSHGRKSMGLFLNPDIDLRLFMEHWKFCFHAVEPGRGKLRKSLQFFDKSGEAVHKIYLTSNSDAAALDVLVKNHRHARQDTSIETEAYASDAPDAARSRVDWEGFRTAWKNLKDTHDFKPMLRRFGVRREQALKGVGQEFANQVPNNSVRRTLEQARDKQCEIMVFVGNRGCIQIHTGLVSRLVVHGNWYNILDPEFSLHLREDRIARSWVTRKPTEDGTVTALEIFDKDGELIALFFGKRKPGIPEQELWRRIIDTLPRGGEGTACVA